MVFASFLANIVALTISAYMRAHGGLQDVGFYNAGLLAGNSYTCYVMATCALISMLNFIIFFFATRKAPGRTYTQKNYRKAEKRADKARKKCGKFQREIL